MRAVIDVPAVGNQKGRAFAAEVIAHVSSDKQGGDLWAVFAGTETELRPFLANLRGGRRAVTGDGGRRRGATGISMGGADYRLAWQREPEGSLTTVFRHDLFTLDTGVIDPMHVSFCVVEPAGWAKAQRLDTNAARAHMMRLPRERYGYRDWVTMERFDELVPLAHVFCAYLDRRTRSPLPSEPRFFVQLFFRLLTTSYASVTSGQGHGGGWLHETGLDRLRMLPAAACHIPHEDLDRILAEEVRQFQKVT